MDSQTEVRQLKEFYKEAILNKPNVVGVGMGYKEIAGQKTEDLCVVALVRQKIPKLGLDPQDLVPVNLEGVLTDVVQVGDLRALQARTDRWRPAPGGVSLGHFKITAGTFGVVVRDRDSNERLILSNNHVLANGNAAAAGDPILQPGAADGGRLKEDTFAVLERFVPISFSVAPAECSLVTGFVALINFFARLLGSKHRLESFKSETATTNLVDAAVARPAVDDHILDEILEIGEITGTTPAQLSMAVRKSGRTTGLTTGEIAVINTTVNIRYGESHTARFEDQIVTGPMSEGGDSGSLLVAADSLKAVGLLFGGSEQSTVFNPIQAVLEALNVSL